MTELYAVSFMFRVQGHNLQLLFKSEQVAASALEKFMMREFADITIVDDFGITASIHVDDVMCAACIDLNRQFEGQGDVGIAQTRAQIKANNAAQADPAIRTAQMMANGAPSFRS